MKILKELRNNLNITQKDLAKKLLIEQNTLSQYEANKFPSFLILKKITKIFEITLDYLILEKKCYYPRSFNLTRIYSMFLKICIYCLKEFFY